MSKAYQLNTALPAMNIAYKSYQLISILESYLILNIKI